ncbi:helicase-related protein [Pelobacter propionicus]|uniref:Helicase domain protein n=1 Tax=Pelobacter propionicus (strain DSM 2379 / NBRC 103807 / OttBd1) TaxID=338966 RepID=A1AQ67_PELPD|nr:helicase-related protein [Pelobacter propionicus]ABK99487.1 helicase domain protein [Pelobacter propionicus DSM 2379]
MLKLEEIRKNAAVNGIEPGQTVRIVTTEPVGTDALTVYYKTSDGRVLERMLFRTDELQLSITKAGRPWSFDADGADFKIATEAYRINLAYLFDSMMAVHTSNVQPLPHQITAVYESMLPRQPLRYVLADDPGAGKTVMAGLYIRELMMRADAQRVLIIAPGSLVEQWQDELYEKFGLTFTIFSRELEQQSRTGNAFYENDTLIARLDQLSRSEDLQEKLTSVNWDLVIFDEAHKLSATWYGQKVTETKRFKLAKFLGSTTRHLLLMTATPHNGKEEDFQLFLSLLDSDRFYGKFRDGAHKVDTSDLMRRMVKEELLKFDGTKLFPERRAYTANYQLSEMEARLYHSVTEYVKEEMNKADELEGGRRGTVGFALTALQRRLASSPEAIYQSLKRRHLKLKRRVADEKLRQRGQLLTEVTGFDVPENIYDSADEMGDDEYERFEEAVVDQATAAQTIQELEVEIHILEGLVNQASDVVHSGQDRKWEELSNLLQNTPEMRDKDGRQRKLIIFTEHKDTLHYLVMKIRGLIGSEDSVVTIHGGVKRDDRRKIQELFRNDPEVRVLVATDAAGEGINLQNANLMVNYDLPWNPNRLEQRFGRIHRIGQDQVCHLWNMVANETREGDVFQRLLDKLEIERQALGGRVFDILGEVFENKSLRELLIDAVRYGDDPIRQLELNHVVDEALDTTHLRNIMNRNALCEEIMDEQKLFAVKDDMEKAEARKLQPYFIRAFFNQAFKQLGGELRPREAGRFEIMNVPAIIRERDRQISGRDRFSRDPVLKRYERVCFEKQNIRITSNKSMASLLHPGHPLMQSTIDLMLEAHRSKLKQGAILVDHGDPGLVPKVMFLIDHSVREGNQPDKAISRRIQFVEIDQTSNAVNAGWAPHLDLEPIEKSDLALIENILNGDWLNRDLEQVALSYASQNMIPIHFDEIKARRERQVDKTLSAVNERLVKEINYWSDRYIKLQDDVNAGRQPRVQLENVRRTIDELTARLETRKKELVAMRHVISSTPLIVGGALVIPAGLLAQCKGSNEFCADAESRARVEMVAMQAVMNLERSLGYEVTDVSAEKCGWDVTSRPPMKDGKIPEVRHIEVKGRAKGQTTITVTRNEILYGLNQSDKFVLAVVLVDGNNHEGPHYIWNPFTHEPDWGVTSINYDLAQLLGKAQNPNSVTN